MEKRKLKRPVINVRVSYEEKTALTEKARKNGLTLSAFVKDRIRHYDEVISGNHRLREEADTLKAEIRHLVAGLDECKEKLRQKDS